MRVVELFGDDDRATRQMFDEFVHEPIPEDVGQQLSPQRWSCFLGDDRFVDEWRDNQPTAWGPGPPEIPEER